MSAWRPLQRHFLSSVDMMELCVCLCECVCMNQRDEGCKVERSHRCLSEVLAQLSFGSERPGQQVRCWSLLKGQHTLKSKLHVAPPPCRWCKASYRL